MIPTRTARRSYGFASVSVGIAMIATLLAVLFAPAGHGTSAGYLVPGVPEVKTAQVHAEQARMIMAGTTPDAKVN